MTVPNHLEPSARNYEGYLKTILDYSNRHPDEEILSLQTFAGHGFIVNGNQNIATNNYCNNEKFYEFIKVESTIRFYSPKMTNVYFLTLFACCREYYNPGKKKGECRKHGPECKGCGVYSFSD